MGSHHTTKARRGRGGWRRGGRVNFDDAWPVNCKILSKYAGFDSTRWNRKDQHISSIGRVTKGCTIPQKE